jgi:hypothetical protein
MMTKNELRTYSLSFCICLVASFSQNVVLWMLVNPIFPLISIYFYYRIRKNNFQTKDFFFIASLFGASIQEIFIAQRHEKWSLLLGVFFLFLMFFFFILTIQQEKSYLLFGRKNMLFKSVLIIFSAILCYILLFLPILPDYLVFPVFIHVFFMFFSFLISANRTTNQLSYNYVIAGMILFVMTTIIAGVSLFIQDFPLSYFIERLCFLSGINFITHGMLKSNWVETQHKSIKNIKKQGSLTS